MDGACVAQIFPSRKLKALAHSIHANIHTDINIIYPSTRTRTHTHTHMVRLDLWKCLLKKESFELGFEVREGGEILQAGRQRIPDSRGNETERTVANRFETAFRDFQEFFIRWLEGAWSLILGERSWKVRGKCIIEVTVGKSCNLVFAAEFHRQPMEFIKRWCYMVAFVFFKTSQAALFWTFCSRPICSAGKPANSELQ